MAREEEEDKVKRAVDELRRELDMVREEVWEVELEAVGGMEVERELKGLVGFVEGVLGEVVKVGVGKW